MSRFINEEITKKKWFKLLMAFLLPAGAMLAIFAILEVYPFGNATIMSVDCYHQYTPFLIELRDKLLSGDSLFYSWNSGLGSEYYAIYANYEASPLNLFVVFVTATAVPAFVAFITVIRAGLAGVFMTLFLSSNDSKRIDAITVVFASSYALCGWFLTDYWNIMWCDALVLLPLIALGLKKLMLEGKYSLYVISLAVCIYSNFYAGFFICLFLSLFAVVYYFIIHTFSKDRSITNRMSFASFFKSAGRFALGSAIAGGLTAVLTIPTYIILQNSSATGGDFPVDFKLTTSLFDFLARFMVVAHPNIRDGMANVYCGVMMVLLLPLFFMAPKKSGITLKHKIGFGFLVAFMYLSFSNRMLNYIWHGFHFPNQIPYRQSFLMSFLIVFMAFMVIRRIRFFSTRSICTCAVGAGCYLILFEKFGEGNENYLQIGLTLVFVLIQGLVLRAISLNTNKRKGFYTDLVVSMMILEMLVATCGTVGQVAMNEGYPEYNLYTMYRVDARYYAQKAEGSDGHAPFERTEIYPANSCNVQSIYGVKGISIFSSTARESFVVYMRNFGFHNNGINSIRTAGLSQVTATILGVRNFVCVGEGIGVPLCFDMELDTSTIDVHGNEDAFAVGFMTSDDIIDYLPDSNNNDSFLKTNEWIRAMGVDADVYSQLQLTNVSCENASSTRNNDGSIRYAFTDTTQDSQVSIVIDEATIGSEVFLYVGANKSSNCVITVGDDDKTPTTVPARSEQIVSLGEYDGNPINVTIKYSETPTRPMNIYAYEQSIEGYQEMLDVLGDEQLLVTSYDSTHLTGTIDAKEDGFLFLSVPYSEGFTVTVDGKETELISVQDALCGVNLTKGTHTISLSYVPVGFKEGALISLASGLAFVLLLAVQIFIKRMRTKQAVAVQSQSDAVGSNDDITSEVVESGPTDSVALKATQTTEINAEPDNQDQESINDSTSPSEGSTDENTDEK